MRLQRALNLGRFTSNKVASILGRSWTCRIAAAGVVAIVAASALHTLWSLLGGAYAADDIWNSQLPAQLHATHQSLISYIVDVTRGWMHSAGRFFPTSIAEGSLVFSIVQTRFSYKVFSILAVISNIVLTYFFVAKLTRQRWTACLVAVLLAAEFDFRYFYDGIQEFGAQQEAMLALVLIAAIATLKYVDSGRKAWAILIAVSWAAAITTYETSYLMLPILWIAIWHRHSIRRRILTSLAASAIPTALIGGYVLYLRLTLTSATPVQYTASMSPTKVLDTLGKQLAGTLPFSQYYFGHTHDLAGIFNAPQFSIFGCFLLVAVAGVIALTLAKQSLSREDNIALLCIGAVLFVVPAAIVAATETWQNTLTWGIAYISVYVQGFGLVLIFVSLIGIVIKKLRSLSDSALQQSLLAGLILVVSCFGSLVILGVAGENVRVITTTDFSLGWMDQQWALGWSRQIAANAAAAGLYGDPKGTETIAAITGAPWINSNEISYESGQKINLVNAYPPWTLQPSIQIPGCPATAGTCSSSAQYQYLLYVAALDYQTGYAVLGKFSSATSMSSTPSDINAVVRDPTIFVQDPRIASSSNVSLCRVGHGGSLHRIRTLQTVRSGANWRLMQGKLNFRVAAGSIGLVISGRCKQF